MSGSCIVWVCVDRFCNERVLLCVGLLMRGCETCGFCNGWESIFVGSVFCGCVNVSFVMIGCVNVWVLYCVYLCVYVPAFCTGGCVYVWILYCVGVCVWMGFLMCGCVYVCVF